VKAGSKGAALAVTMVLLTGLSALALAAGAAAVTALALAGYQQGAAIALEAAESGISRAMEQARVQPGPAAAGPLSHTAGGATEARFTTRTIEQAGSGALPAGFSIGESATSFRSRHYFIVADGEATRGARVRLEQGFYVVGPGQ
jgi:hypothetical protein